MILVKILYALSIILITIAVFCHNSTDTILIYLGVLLNFTIFDIIGFNYLLENYTRRRKKNYEMRLGLYRITQMGMMGILLIIASGTSDPLRACFALFIAWWFGFCDWLYYIVLKDNNYYKDMFWLWWTPYGIINKIIGKKTTRTMLNIYAIIGYILGIIILLY